MLSYYDWNDRLFDEVFEARGDYSPIPLMPLDDSLFLRAAGPENYETALDAKNEFIASLRHELQARTFQALLEDDEQWEPTKRNRRPPFFSLLVLSCLAVIEGDSADPDETSFTAALNSICKNKKQNVGKGLNDRWCRVRDWLRDVGVPGHFEAHDDVPRRYRELILPADVGYAQVGLTLKLAFPRRTDFDRLKTCVSAFGAEWTPTVPQVVKAVKGYSGFGGQFQKVFRDFEERWKTDARFVLLVEIFWQVALRALRDSDQVETSTQGPLAWLLADWDDDGGIRPFAVASSSAVFAGALQITREEADWGEPWTHLLFRAGPHDDPQLALVSAVLDEPERFKDSPLRSVARFAERGALFFEPSDHIDGALELVPRPTGSSTTAALARGGAVERIRSAWSSEPTPSGVPGWQLLTRPPVEQPGPSAVGPVLRIRGGVHVVTGCYLGVPGVAPHVLVEGATSVVLSDPAHRDAKTVQFSNTRDQEWRLPPVALEGNRVIEATVGSLTLQRPVRFTKDFAATPSGKVREPERWFGECGGTNSATSSHGCEVRFLSSAGTRPADMTVPITGRSVPRLDHFLDVACYVGQRVGHFEHDPRSSSDWAVLWLPGGELALDCLATTEAYYPLHERSPGNQRNAAWRDLFTRPLAVVSPGPPGLLEAYRGAARRYREYPVTEAATGFEPSRRVVPEKKPRPEATSIEGALACLLHNRESGVSEGMLLETLGDVLGHPSRELLWSVARAWVEAGRFDLVNTVRYSGRHAFGIRPRFIVHRLGERFVGVSEGLLSENARARVHQAAASLGGRTRVFDGRTSSEWVSPPLMIEADVIETIAMASAESNVLGEPASVGSLENWLPDLPRFVGSSAGIAQPVGHERAGRYDWESRQFTKEKGRTDSDVEVQWFRRDDKASFYVVRNASSGSTWSYSREWALLVAHLWRGDVTFTQNREFIDANYGDWHLPLAVARLGVFLSGTSPGPTGDAGAYRNSFPSELVASRVVAALSNVGAGEGSPR